MFPRVFKNEFNSREIVKTREGHFPRYGYIPTDRATGTYTVALLRDERGKEEVARFSLRGDTSSYSFVTLNYNGA